MYRCAVSQIDSLYSVQYLIYTHCTHVQYLIYTHCTGVQYTYILYTACHSSTVQCIYHSQALSTMT